MPTVFSAKLDGSEAVRYFHVSLVVYYLRQASIHAKCAAVATDSDEMFKDSLLTIIFASFCLEAFTNEMIENVFGDAKLDEYRKKERSMSVGSKLQLLFREKWSVELSTQELLLNDINELFYLRNKLVHYKFSESAAKAYMPPVETRPVDGGGSMTMIDFMKQPTRIEPSLMESTDKHEAVKSYNTALRVIKLWNKKAGAPPDALASFNECMID